MNRLKQLWLDLKGSFWFVPSLIVAISILVAVLLVSVDSTGSRAWMARWPRLFGAGAEGARGMLSTIAGSMMTVVGITFSMTLVALSLASSQYTPRILRNFMGDRVTQIVLGVFAGIFTYCLIVLRTIRGGETAGFIPSLAVTFGFVLAIGGISVLIFFIHHIASLIQASNIIGSVAAETMAGVDRLFPATLGEGPDDNADSRAATLSSDRDWHPVPAGRDGYIQGVDDQALLSLSRERETIVRMECGIGAFVVRDAPLAWLALEVPPAEEVMAELQAAFSVNRHRTIEQDSAYGIGLIVDMALRALSPGINDTTTAVMCVDYLTAILARLARRSIPSTYRYEDGRLRVIAIGPTFARLVAESFDQIRSSSGGNPAMLIRMLAAIHTIARLTDRASRRRVLDEHVREIAELAERTIDSPRDRTRFRSRLALLRETLPTG